MKLFTPLVLLAGLAGRGYAQPAQPAPGTERSFDALGGSPEPVPFVALSARERFHDFAQRTFGVYTLALQPVSALASHVVNSPPEWGRGANGFAKRLGWVTFNLVAQNTIEYGLATALREDNTYYRCTCNGFWARAGHAVVSPLLTRTPEGRKRIAFSRILAAYAGGLATVPILPRRFNYKGDGVRYGNWNYGAFFPLDLAREFFPDLKTIFHRH